jgi:hypothetical protein
LIDQLTLFDQYRFSQYQKVLCPAPLLPFAPQEQGWRVFGRNLLSSGDDFIQRSRQELGGRRIGSPAPPIVFLDLAWVTEI